MRMHACKFGQLFALFLIAASLNAATPDASAPLRIHGGTVMVRSKLHATIFVVRQGDGDGPAEHLFQVWWNPGLPLEAVYRGADVEFTGTALIVVVPTEKSANTYTVAGHKAPAIPIPDGFSTATFEVVGLNHVIGSGVEQFTVHTPSSTDRDSLPFEDPWAVTGGETRQHSFPEGLTARLILDGPGAARSA